ncbi:MAG: homoserine O-succinyltransferase [Chitinophagaceae bacterium]|nr:homoserine O-succinyltransferase [Chitinophagaceae bacterium]
MTRREKKPVRIALLDLYRGASNQGMRGIREILRKYFKKHDLAYVCDEYEVRIGKKLPGLDYDIYISSGGPGSPLASEGSEWEDLYFSWLKNVQDYNRREDHPSKKHVLFVCHSFQLACRYFGVGRVAKRKSTAFGVFPVHLVEKGKEEPVFHGLNDPFFAVDSRNYQVIGADHAQLSRRGMAVLAIEKERPHVPLERAIMAVRFNPYMMGTQFHPEADPRGMSMYLQRQDKKEKVIASHGVEKWQSMIDQLNDPDKIRWTYAHIIPNFLNKALSMAVKPQAS